jgi:hypothetical protein
MQRTALRAAADAERAAPRVLKGERMTTNIGRVGYWSGLAAFASTVAYVGVQLLQVAGVLGFRMTRF